MAAPLLKHSSKHLYSLVYFLLYETTFAREENDKRAHIVGKRYNLDTCKGNSRRPGLSYIMRSMSVFIWWTLNVNLNFAMSLFLQI